jgi:hypothetical protein
MSVPTAAILYKLRTTYASYKFEVQENRAKALFIVNVFEKGKRLGSKSFSTATPMDEFWDDIKAWMRTILR